MSWMGVLGRRAERPAEPRPHGRVDTSKAFHSGSDGGVEGTDVEPSL